jgi:predicted kinase
MEKILYIMCGVGFSGKSTLAKKISEHKQAALVSQDAIYFEKEKELDPTLSSDKEWELIWNIAIERVVGYLKQGKSVVYDSTNTRREHRDRFRKIALENNARAIVVYLNTPDEVLLARQMKNKETKERHDVKQEYLDQARAEMEIPQSDENPIVFTPESDLVEWLDKLD